MPNIEPKRFIKYQLQVLKVPKIDYFQTIFCVGLKKLIHWYCEYR